MTDLAGIWYNLVATYSESNPELAEAVLAAVKRYVSWIDIGLVANDRCAIDDLYHAPAPPASLPCSYVSATDSSTQGAEHCQMQPSKQGIQ